MFLESKERAKKLASVLATSTPVTKTRKKVAEAAGADKDGKKSEDKYLENLAQVSCIRYSIIFQKKSVLVLALLDLGNEINAIYTTFAQELGLPIRPMDVAAQKIDGSMLNTFRIIVTAFSLIDKANQIKFFEKTFLVANINLEIVLRMPFLTLSGMNIKFLD